jgi:hypothetical protein
MSRLYRARKLLESAMLLYAREHGYLRDGEPAKMRSRDAARSGDTAAPPSEEFHHKAQS